MSNGRVYNLGNEIGLGMEMDWLQVGLLILIVPANFRMKSALQFFYFFFSSSYKSSIERKQYPYPS